MARVPFVVTLLECMARVLLEGMGLIKSGVLRGRVYEEECCLSLFNVGIASVMVSWQVQGSVAYSVCELKENFV